MSSGTPRTPPGQSDLNIDGAQLVALDYNDNELVISYACQFLVENNPYTPIEVSFYYDLLFDSGEDAATERQYFEFLLLNKIAQEYGLASGNACITPPETGNLYLVQATSLPEDVPNPQFNKCFTLRPSAGQECISYSGTVSGYVLGPDDSTPLVNYIAQSLFSGIVTAGTSLQAAFLGTHIDPAEGGRDSLTAAINEETPATLADEGGAFTYVGILLTLALVGAFVGLGLVVFRMRQRRQNAWREEAAMNQARESSFDEGMVLNEGVVEKELPSQYGLAHMVIHPDDDDSEGLPEQASYTFDLGDNMKLGVLGKHGGGSSCHNWVVIPDESSDSDVDSWAQTDATLGSLEVRIGEITAEI